MKLALLVFAASSAAVTLASVFTEHMVLQRDVRCRFGVALRPAHRWWSSLQVKGIRPWATLAATGAFASRHAERVLTRLRCASHQATESRELNDILVGEVWLCAGQSNVE